MQYKPCTILDSVVFALISFKSIPPAVTISESLILEIAFNFKLLIEFIKISFSVFFICAVCLFPSIL